MTLKIIHVSLIFISLFTTFIAQADISTDALVKQNAEKIAQVEIFNRASGQNVSTGSGFFINEQGLMATNYHVVSKVVFDADIYAIRYVDSLGEQQQAKLVDIDIINDLALLQTEIKQSEFFTLAADVPGKGHPLYSLGNPLNLGMVVTPGNYNGLIEHRFIERINLTGAINPGMSGGPTINSAAQVVGINVTTRGNQMGGLVPVSKLQALLSSYQDLKDSADTEDFIPKITQQLTAHQQALFTPLLASQWSVEELGATTILKEISDVLSCGTNTNESLDKRQYDYISVGCSLNEYTFLNQHSKLAGFSYSFALYESDKLNSTQLARLYHLAMNNKPRKSHVSYRDMTNFQCDQGILSTAVANNIKTSFCIRAYRQHEGLFDVRFAALLLGKEDKGLVAKFSLNGVSQHTAQTFASKFMENVKWN